MTNYWGENSMPCGRIIKALSGFYYVIPEQQQFSESSLIQCRARGLFRMKGESPLVGDIVNYEVADQQEGVVTEILERKNSLIRPPIANVDQVFLVFSVNQPDLSVLLLDRFLIHIEQANIQATICLSKSDLLDPAQFDQAVEYYRNIGYSVFITSAKSELGIQAIRKQLQNKITVFAGQSGVGKSTLLNLLLPNANLKTSEISHRLGRGKHTTRHVELLPVDDNSWVADTPGFSQLDFQDIEPEQLSHYFSEMKMRLDQCKFRGCLHDREPSCAIRKAVEEGVIAEWRYAHYIQFLSEVQEAKQRRY